MKNVGVVFLLKYAGQSQIVMPEPNARIIIRDWKQGTLKGFVGNENDPFPWAISVDCIQAIQVVQLQEQGVQTAEVPTKLPSGCSGYTKG